MKISEIKKLYEDGEVYSGHNIIFKNKVDVYVEEAIFSLIENENEKLFIAQKYITLAKENLQMLIDMLEINKNKTFEENLNYVKSILEMKKVSNLKNTHVNDNKPIEIEENMCAKDKYSDLKVLVGFIAMLLMFFVFNHLDQKNNVETIQILNYENQQLKKGLSPQIQYLEQEKRMLSNDVQKTKKENHYLRQDIKKIEDSNQKLKNQITILNLVLEAKK